VSSLWGAETGFRECSEATFGVSLNEDGIAG
jgi:hypothetical protein